MARHARRAWVGKERGCTFPKIRGAQTRRTTAQSVVLHLIFLLGHPKMTCPILIFERVWKEFYCCPAQQGNNRRRTKLAKETDFLKLFNQKKLGKIKHTFCLGSALLTSAFGWQKSLYFYIWCFAARAENVIFTPLKLT